MNCYFMAIAFTVALILAQGSSQIKSGETGAQTNSSILVRGMKGIRRIFLGSINYVFFAGC
ncbi:MAG: hypothetical protein N3E45_02100 [Oscillatoriaceae bacterium SKW80]|nr:hypothetical protein [Oscillatoriaceae bacterium SKYG93]MCX8119618.1 hypothetical protein [Oscillatoriaceae bacterium SKW80]MDW8455085.1 hypothetical protein [Oscillatoriaceae cyanobacterium SKYGB_i_bin93]HIK28139.1 hypothetical protein [Oscillatoriaceae cyanobacterium M7585_C2015_266]